MEHSGANGQSIRAMIDKHGWAPRRGTAQHAHPADVPAGALKIGRFLKIAFPIYRSCTRRGAADAQSVRRLQPCSRPYRLIHDIFG
jgi:hypothetical protein